MATTIEDTPITRKTRELCQTILDEPSMQALRQRIDTFMADEQTRAQYDGLITKGQALQEKQQRSVALTGEEISDFEQHRDSLLNNPVARGFLDAQQELHQVQESIQKYVSKTLELGRLPSEDELCGDCCGGTTRLRLQPLASGKELPPPPDLEPAGIGVHLDEDEFLRRLAAADVCIAPVIPILDFGRRNLAGGGLAVGRRLRHHQDRRLV